MDVKNNPSFARRRALVLGGGGSSGNAWLIGVVAGLFDAGLDVNQADLIIGTSAGSTTAVQISNSTTPPELFAGILAGVPDRKTSPVGSDNGSAPNRSAMVNHMETTSGIINSAKDVVDMRKKMGTWALGTAATSDNATKQWRSIVAARLPVQMWPQREIFITAVNAHTGEPVVFNRHSGIDLVDAVAASCAGGFAYGIGDGHYIDGGYRSNADNADLAAGSERVLVLSPFGGKSRTPAEWGTHLSTQIEELRASGTEVETIFPDNAALDAFGDNMTDLSRRPQSAQAGYEQGRSIAMQLTEFWC
jgi:NTE family protein